MEFSVEKTRIRIIMGDITEQNTDAVVNAANNSLMGGGGVDGAIHRKGGPTILKECKKIRETEWPNGLSTGNAVITKGGNLKAKYVIHTVGPIWNGGDQGEPELLASAYRNSLRLAVSKGLKTIAFPSISTGAYNYPIEKASRVAMETVVTFLKEENQLDGIVFVLFSSAALDSYKDTAKDLVKMRALRDFTREHETEARII